MRFLLRATIPVEAGNAMVHDPAAMQQKFETIFGDFRPEAVYFCLDRGQRTIYAVVNIETHELPRVVEPFWLSFGADIELLPAMSQEDFGKAGEFIQAAASKY